MMTGEMTMTMIGRRLCVLLLMLAFALGGIGTASAQQGDDNPGKVVELESIDVVGQIAKPQVFYILARASVRYEQLKLDQSFVDRIVQTARINPF